MDNTTKIEKIYLVFVSGKTPWELRNKFGRLIRRRKTAGCLQDWAKENGYNIEHANNPIYENEN
jgi:hypothetical protein